jgi:hypothetical protein
MTIIAESMATKARNTGANLCGIARSLEAEFAPLNHLRRLRKLHVIPPLRGDPPPAEGKKKPAT